MSSAKARQSAPVGISERNLERRYRRFKDGRPRADCGCRLPPLPMSIRMPWETSGQGGGAPDEGVPARNPAIGQDREKVIVIRPVTAKLGNYGLSPTNVFCSTMPP